MQILDRARREDLQKKIRYEVAYIKNKKGKVIIDRRFNTASLMNVYLGRGVVDEQGVSWNPDDPNRLSFQLPGEAKQSQLRAACWHTLSTASAGLAPCGLEENFGLIQHKELNSHQSP